MTAKSTPNESLRVGDVVCVWGAQPWYTIERIEPYDGPLRDIIFAIAHFKRGAGPFTGISLAKRGYSDVLAIGTLPA